MSDYRIKVSARNNRILERIEDAGYPSVAQFAAAFGLTYTSVNSLICMRDSAFDRDGKYRPIVEDIASALSCSTDDLFTKRQAAGKIKTTTRIIDEPAMIALSDMTKQDDVSALPSPECAAYQKQMADKYLDVLTPRERQVIKAKFWDNETFEDIAARFGISNGRAQQIERKAIYKMQRASGKFRNINSEREIRRINPNELESVIS